MGKRVYYFGDFCLDPVARELTRNGEAVTIAANAFGCLTYLIEHRERAVGKDELVSAVWGRVDVSDNLLAQTIVRLRRALGDAGAGQRCIRTIPRVGYRWMLDTVVADMPGETAEQVPASSPDVLVEPLPAPGLQPSPWRGRALWIAALCMLAAAVGYWRWSAVRQPLRLGQGVAIVLPAEVNAPADWKWLRFGLMGLLSNELHDARIPVESSQTVLSLLDQPGGNPHLDTFALVIHPRVTLVDKQWHVHLDARTADGRTWQAESSTDNVLNAARWANTRLLAQMGVAVRPAAPTTDDAKEEYLMRIDVATNAGSSDVARELIDKAPANIREMPEFDYAKAVFHCSEDELAPCKQGLADLLQRLPADEQPTLRGRVLAQQYYVYYREHKYAEGVVALSEAVALLQKQSNKTYLAFAYAQRGELEKVQGKLDQAQADFGLARANYALDSYDVAALDMDGAIAEVAMRRGQFAQAIPVLQRAYDEYQRMGMRRQMPDILMQLAIARRMLLQYAEELAATDIYWPLQQKHWGIEDRISRHLLAYERAQALANNGRTAEANDLLESVLTQIASDPQGEPGLQDTVYVLLAKLALQRNDIQAAQSWIGKAMDKPLLERNNDNHDYASAWLTNALVMQRAGKTKEFKDAVDALQTWAAGLPARDEWIDILLLRAQAAEAWSEGRHDQALDQLKLAMSKADAYGVPELIVDVAQVYTQALIAAGKVEDAASISGKLSTWSQVDWRAAWAQACVYRALGQMPYAEQYQSKARQLAGDRVLPSEASVFLY
ncbi:winged helix-turn-helix domain-containing protein [Dyella sp.]|uniref:winged helix-turn-helix domain-containing protein n=1 Tax=Dyella sp. TaxID=1869338 RepID=UPI002B4965D9|nr:winged helix-turn-helix domain-containing protein [Dyella sp.]HKT28444.1 winged helix-turn-helix domain-containing protein [Dyella sp.]